MRLTEARGGERLVVEGREQFAEPAAKLLLDDLLDVGEQNGADIVLKLFELVDVGLGDEIRARRENLPELHVRGPELDEALAERDRAFDGAVAVGVVARGRLLGHELDEALSRGEVAKAVAGEQPDRRRQTWQEARSQDHAQP